MITNYNDFDVLIIGAGPAGAVAARRLAEEAGRKVLVMERRNHIAGNTYDCLDEAGILIHQYGPHIYHNNSERVHTFLSRFTQWLPYEHRVVANVHGDLMPVPFNLTSLEQAFGMDRGTALREKLIATYGEEKKVTILELRQNQDTDIREVAEYIYKNVFVSYTMKQWGTTPEQIDPNTTARVPIFLSRDDRYFQDTYQGMPTDGYTALFQSMLDHPNITVQLDVDAIPLLNMDHDVLMVNGVAFTGEVIYTGAVDELFDCKFGRLPYRTLDFQFETLPQTQFQSHGTVNYTVSEDYTRITEYKHMTGQQKDGVTTIVKEFARAFTGAKDETPYYAIINPENNALYGQYRTLGEQFENLHLLGRLAEYKYYNMDAIVERALQMCDLLEKKENKNG